MEKFADLLNFQIDFFLSFLPYFFPIASFPLILIIVKFSLLYILPDPLIPAFSEHRTSVVARKLVKISSESFRKISSESLNVFDETFP